jgi:hypothetical protein
MKDSWGKDTQKKIYSLAQTKLNESIGVDYTNIKAHMVDVVKKRRMERELSGTGEELDEVESVYNTALDAWIEVLDAATESKRLDKEELLRIEREGIRSQKDMKRMLLPQSSKKRLDTSESDENDTSSGSDLDSENGGDSTKEASTTNLVPDGASSAYERSASSTISRGETPAASVKSRKRKRAPLSQVKTTEEKLLSAVDGLVEISKRRFEMKEKRDTTTTSDLSKRVDQIEEAQKRQTQLLEQSQQQSAEQYSGIMAAIARLTEKAG